MLQRSERARSEAVIEHWLALNCYVEGWAEVNLAKILDAAAPDYYFYDPLVGRFSWSSLPQYFERVRGRFARTGEVVRQDLAFLLHGPMNKPFSEAEGTLLFQREAPHIGLTGMTWIVIGPCGVIAEHVAYDLNLASVQLREGPRQAGRVTAASGNTAGRAPAVPFSSASARPRRDRIGRLPSYRDNHGHRCD